MTFDQPLYWKSLELIESASDDDVVKSIVLLLGLFHLLINYLGAVGHLMTGSGMEEILGELYGDSVMPQILSGKSVQRAFRAHTLLDQAITDKLVRPLMEDPTFVSSVTELEKLYKSDPQPDVTDCHLNEILAELSDKIDTLESEICDNTRTGKLWVNYRNMCQIARDLVRSERTGDWKLHLDTVRRCLPVIGAAGHYNYLKSTYAYYMIMSELQHTNPEIYESFMSGLFVARRSDKFWAGIGSDMAIEQVLMRTLKSRSGLTRGSGLTEDLRSVWTLSAPVLAEYNLALQEATGVQYTTSLQHRELSKARINRDHNDKMKLKDFLSQYEPFSDTPDLRNIVTGVIANPIVDVDNVFDVGSKIIRKMEGGRVLEFSFSRKDKAVTMNTPSAIELDANRTIDPAALFQRMLIIANSGDVTLEDMVKYELCPFPPALFSGPTCPLVADKAPLAHAILDMLPESTDDDVDVGPADHYIFDGGSLLHRTKWGTGLTYGEIADGYCSLVQKYFRPTVVFDGYGDANSIKESTHQHRNPNPGPLVEISAGAKFSGKKETVLSNVKNKDRMIKLIMERMRMRKIKVVQVQGDADLDIVLHTIKMATSGPTTLIAEDTDLLILLLRYWTSDHEKVIMRSDKKAKKNPLPNYNIGYIKRTLGPEKCELLLFLHAFTGRDSVSRICSIGKKGALTKFFKSTKLRSLASTFCTPNMDRTTIAQSGLLAMQELFGKPSLNVNKIRHVVLSNKIAKSTSFVKPEQIPPTEDATMHHAYRTYYQVMVWLGKDLDPRQWGWTVSGEKLTAHTMDQSPAPDNLLKIIRCNCTTSCSTNRCGCRKYGLPCTAACGVCQTTSWDNGLTPSVDDDEDED